MKLTERSLETKVSPPKKVQKTLKVHFRQSCDSKEKLPLPYHWKRGLSLHNISKKSSRAKLVPSRSTSTLKKCDVYYCSPIFVPKRGNKKQPRKISLKNEVDKRDIFSKTSLYDVIQEAESQLSRDRKKEKNNNLMNVAFCESDEDNMYEDVANDEMDNEEIYEIMEPRGTYAENESNYYMRMSSVKRL